MFGMEYRPKCVLVSVMCFVLMLSLSLGFCFVAEFSPGVVRLFNVHGVAVLFLFWFSGVCSLAPVVGFGIKCDLIYPPKKGAKCRDPRKYLQIINFFVCKWTLHGSICYPVTMTGPSFFIGKIVNQSHLAWTDELACFSQPEIIYYWL